ncbi:Crp/Fnr family transcriptional regulator [Marinobacterium sp. D7]|uniref:Crp/Fnr family transcriptional regulator n=1 Tax=Marinobacterium ramblicola TaxID=2849041 RepID=UPI001C2CED52|nr:Crp/Fnr family transcriptional regulator [Marinobacterium ramblicola]MBV1787353.1 Crp/Fnr family transcriptional regulator [Marinobacterium ramblicola]
MKVLDAQALWDDLGALYFRELSTFGALPDSVVLHVLRGGRVLQLDQGDTLYRENERTDSFFVVLRGVVNLYSLQEGGNRILVRQNPAGTNIGFAAMISLTPHVVSAVAAESATVVEIDSRQFSLLHEEEPEAFGILLLNLTRDIARTLMKLGVRIIELESRNPPSKETNP